MITSFARIEGFLPVVQSSDQTTRFGLGKGLFETIGETGEIRPPIRVLEATDEQAGTTIGVRHPSGGDLQLGFSPTLQFSKRDFWDGEGDEAGTERGRQPFGLRRNKEKGHARTRLFDVLQERVKPRRIQAFGMVDEENTMAAARRGAVGALEKGANGFDAGFLLGVKEGDVRMAFERQWFGMIDQTTSKALGEATLTDVFGTKKTVRSRRMRLHAVEETKEIGVAAKREMHGDTLPHRGRR